MTSRGSANKAPKVRKRYGPSSAAPIRIDLTDPKWADLREQVTGATVLSPADSEAVLRWIETGKDRPSCV